VPQRDLYDVLGVPRTASADEVKTAYRTLAKKYHPDRNPGDKAAEEKFKEVTAAADVLTDPKRRALYDEFGADSLRSGFDPAKAEQYRQWKQHGAPQGGMPFDFGDFERVNVGDFGAFDFGSLFEDLFGAQGRGGVRGGVHGGVHGRTRARRHHGPIAGGDAEAEIEVDLGEAVRGGERDLRIGGKTLRVRIPAGVADGSSIRLAGQGSQGVGGGPSGDLYLRVRLREHPVLRRDGRDLVLDLPVTVPEAALGAEVTLPTFEGSVRLRVPSGAQSGTRLRLRGKGLPDLKGGTRGDLYAVVKIVLPEASAQLEEAVKPLRDLYKGDPRAGLTL
jgi:curved DNA-binding protein